MVNEAGAMVAGMAVAITVVREAKAAEAQARVFPRSARGKFTVLLANTYDSIQFTIESDAKRILYKLVMVAILRP